MACKDCDGSTRRDFIRHGAGGFIGMSLMAGMPFPIAWGQDTEAKKKGQDSTAQKSGKAKSIILLWMSGGPSQLDTWDPKPGNKNGGPTKAIDTKTPGLQLSHNLPLIAKHTDKLAVIRSLKTSEPDHGRGTYLMHTSYSPDPSVQHPNFGSIMAREVEGKKIDLPPYVCIGGDTVGEGYMSAEFSPYIIGNAMGEIPNLSAWEGVDANRERSRRRMLVDFEKSFSNGRKYEFLAKRADVYGSAIAMMDSPLTKAFNLKDEKKETREAFGMNPFGQGCLMARRLVATGVKFVEVQLGGWDTHDNNFERVGILCKDMDRGFAALLEDMDKSGLLSETLVLWMGEFGRTPQINGNNGRDHFARAWSIAMAGGGIPGGRFIGATTDDGMDVKEHAVSAKETFASIYSLMGVDFHKQYYSPEGRPIPFVQEEKAKNEHISPIAELLA